MKNIEEIIKELERTENQKKESLEIIKNRFIAHRIEKLIKHLNNGFIETEDGLDFFANETETLARWIAQDIRRYKKELEAYQEIKRLQDFAKKD